MPPQGPHFGATGAGRGDSAATGSSSSPAATVGGYTAVWQLNSAWNALFRTMTNWSITISTEMQFVLQGFEECTEPIDVVALRRGVLVPKACHASQSSIFGMAGVRTWREAVAPTAEGTGYDLVTGFGHQRRGGVGNGTGWDHRRNGARNGSSGVRWANSRQTAAASSGVISGVRMRDAAGGVAGHRDAGVVRAIPVTGDDRVRGDVAQADLAGIRFVVDAVHDTARQLSTQSGGTLAEVVRSAARRPPGRYRPRAPSVPAAPVA